MVHAPWICVGITLIRKQSKIDFQKWHSSNVAAISDFAFLDCLCTVCFAFWWENRCLQGDTSNPMFAPSSKAVDKSKYKWANMPKKDIALICSFLVKHSQNWIIFFHRALVNLSNLWVACLSIHVVVVIYQLNINWWSNSTLSAFEFLPGPKLAMKLGKFVPNHVWATICQIVFGTPLKHTDLERRSLLMIQWHFHNHPD